MDTQRPIESFIADFAAATPDQIRSWSSGSIKRRLRPGELRDDWRIVADTLWDQRIFGPVNELECACGKFSGIQYIGVVCDRCRVKVMHSKAREIRFGHINLATPIPHPFVAGAKPLDAVPIIPARNWETIAGEPLAAAYDELLHCSVAGLPREDHVGAYGVIIAHIEHLITQTPEDEIHQRLNLARGLALVSPDEVAPPEEPDTTPAQEKEWDVDWDNVKFVDN